MAWVINTNTNTCYIYNYSKKPMQLSLIKHILHPENKLRDIDLTSDKPGRYAFGAYEQPTDPKEIKIDNFAREIAKELDVARRTQSYDSLIIITLPQMQGLLAKHMSEQVKKLITHTISKELLQLSERELLEFLKENTQYIG